MSARIKAVGFGCPDTTDPHHFKVRIPRATSEPVLIIEDFGLSGGRNGRPDEIARCRLQRNVWTQVREPLKRALNDRLRQQHIPQGTWTAGETRVERLLGKELCLFAWAIEHADAVTVTTAIRNWLALSPEERWWLFAMVANTAGDADDVEIGWRKAVRIALTETPAEGVVVRRLGRQRQGGPVPRTKTLL